MNFRISLQGKNINLFCIWRKIVNLTNFIFILFNILRVLLYVLNVYGFFCSHCALKYAANIAVVLSSSVAECDVSVDKSTKSNFLFLLSL